MRGQHVIRFVLWITCARRGAQTAHGEKQVASVPEDLKVKRGYSGCRTSRTHNGRGCVLVRKAQYRTECRGISSLGAGASKHGASSSGSPGALFYGRIRVLQRFSECFLPREDLGQVGVRMMVHVLAGNIGEAILGSDIGKVHGERKDVSQNRGVRRSRVGESAAAIFPDADSVVALPASPVVLPIVDEGLVRTNCFQRDTFLPLALARSQNAGHTAHRGACPIINESTADDFVSARVGSMSGEKGRRLGASVPGSCARIRLAGSERTCRIYASGAITASLPFDYDDCDGMPMRRVMIARLT